MKKTLTFVFILLLLLSKVQMFAETNGQFEGRLYQVNERASNFRKTVMEDDYFERVEFETYVDSGAKVAAYAEFLSEGWDYIYQTFSSLRSNEWGREIMRLSDVWYSIMESWDNWANKLTGKRVSDGKSWKDIYHTQKLVYYFLLKGGASRL